MILVDYGNEAPVLCAHADGRGTLRTNRRPHQDGSAGAAPAWLDRPGEHDITADVDFSSIRLAAEARGCTTMGLMDQTYFLMAVAGSRLESFDEAERQAFNALVRPGGIGSTMKVLVVGKGMGAVSVRGCSSTARLT
jgi:SAM-dependent MidA family methyltransferase